MPRGLEGTRCCVRITLPRECCLLHPEDYTPNPAGLSPQGKGWAASEGALADRCQHSLPEFPGRILTVQPWHSGVDPADPTRDRRCLPRRQGLSETQESGIIGSEMIREFVSRETVTPGCLPRLGKEGSAPSEVQHIHEM